MKSFAVAVRSLGLITLLLLLGWGPPELDAQQAPSAQSATLPNRFGYLEDVLRALDASQAIVYQVIGEYPAGVRDLIDSSVFTHLVGDGVAAGVTPSTTSAGGEHGPSAPDLPADIQAVLDRTDALYWSILSLAADPDSSRLDNEKGRLLEAYAAGNALSSSPADMVVVEASTPAGAFQEAYPRLHGLIWAQTWLKLAVLEPLLLERTQQARQAGVTAVLARFWSMLEEPPLHFPTAMPMAPAVAQNFTLLNPAVAAIFENEDMLRESIGNILVSQPEGSRQDALLAATAGLRDGGYRRVNLFSWRQMAVMHGIGNQGGFAIGIVPPPEQEAGMSHVHSPTSVMPGMN
jgi:hypothetical protein